MREEEKVKKEKERQAEIDRELTKQKYQQFDEFKDTIYKDLDEAEEQIKRKEKEDNEKKAEEFFNRNYYALNDGFSDSEPSSSIYQNNMKDIEYMQVFPIMTGQ